MEMVNELTSSNTLSKDSKIIINKMISPFLPHLAEEVWSLILGNNDSIFSSRWPQYQLEKIKEDTVKIAIQVNGKLRGAIEVDKGTDKNEVLKASKEIENIKKYLDEGEIIKEIYVENKIINYVIKKESFPEHI